MEPTLFIVSDGEYKLKPDGGVESDGLYLLGQEKNPSEVKLFLEKRIYKMAEIPV